MVKFSKYCNEEILYKFYNIRKYQIRSFYPQNDAQFQVISVQMNMKSYNLTFTLHVTRDQETTVMLQRFHLVKLKSIKKTETNIIRQQIQADFQICST
jgi:hypothetical protein